MKAKQERRQERAQRREERRERRQRELKKKMEEDNKLKAEQLEKEFKPKPDSSDESSESSEDVELNLRSESDMVISQESNENILPKLQAQINKVRKINKSEIKEFINAHHKKKDKESTEEVKALRRQLRLMEQQIKIMRTKIDRNDDIDAMHAELYRSHTVIRSTSNKKTKKFKFLPQLERPGSQVGVQVPIQSPFKPSQKQIVETSETV